MVDQVVYGVTTQKRQTREQHDDALGSAAQVAGQPGQRKQGNEGNAGTVVADQGHGGQGGEKQRDPPPSAWSEESNRREPGQRRTGCYPGRGRLGCHCSTRYHHLHGQRRPEQPAWRIPSA
jgi:hypothetical protein